MVEIRVGENLHAMIAGLSRLLEEATGTTDILDGMSLCQEQTTLLQSGERDQMQGTIRGDQ